MPHHSGSSILQVPLSASTLQRDQCPSYLHSANFIPAGAILFTNTPVIIPNTGLANGNAVEVLYAPQTPSNSLPQTQTTSHVHIQGPILQQHQHNSPCFRDVKSQDHAAWVKDLVRQRIQASKQQQEEVRRNETHSSLFQQDLSATQRPVLSNIGLLQKLLVNNGAVGENSTSLRTSEQYVRTLRSPSSNCFSSLFSQLRWDMQIYLISDCALKKKCFNVRKNEILFKFDSDVRRNGYKSLIFSTKCSKKILGQTSK